jgi:hypothetical protein
VVQPARPQMTVEYGAERMRFACRTIKARIQTHTLIIFNNYYCQQQSGIFCSSTTVKREPTVAFHWQHSIPKGVDSYIYANNKSELIAAYHGYTNTPQP